MIIIRATLKIFNAAIMSASRALFGLAAGGRGVPGGDPRGKRKGKGRVGKLDKLDKFGRFGRFGLYGMAGYGMYEGYNALFGDDSDDSDDSMDVSPDGSLSPGEEIINGTDAVPTDSVSKNKLGLNTDTALAVGGTVLGLAGLPYAAKKIKKNLTPRISTSPTPAAAGAKPGFLMTAEDKIRERAATQAKASSRWGRFLAFVAKKSPALFARLGVKLAAMAGMATIPIAGWLAALFQLGFIGFDLYAIYSLWSEFTGTDEEAANPDVNAAKVAASQTASTAPGPVPAADTSSASSTSTSPSAQVGKVTSDMGMRPDPMNSGKTQNHQGVDVAAPSGTPIYATMDGQARKYTNSETAGNYVEVTDAQGNKTRYLHMSRHEGWIQGGVVRPVKKGDIIGYVGTTGRSTGNHLHYEEYRNGKNVTDRSGAMLALNPTTPTTPNLAAAPVPKINGPQVASASQAQVHSVDNAIEAAAGKPLFSPEDLAAFAAALRAPTMQGAGGGQVLSIEKATPYERDFYQGVVRAVAL